MKKYTELIVLIIAGLSMSGCCSLNPQTTKVQKVKEKERAPSQYLVFTEDEVFEVVDDFLVFDSSDTYRKIDIGKCYVFETTGVRFPLLSWYRNIVGLKEVKCKQ